MKVVKMGAGFGLAIALAVGLQATTVEAQEASTSSAPDTRVEIRKSNQEAGVKSVAGRVTLESGGESARVNAGTRFGAGDVVRVATGSKLTVEMADGAWLALVGPTELQFTELNPDARRVLLRSGVVSKAYMEGVALEIATPYDGALVLQNATGFARVRLGDRVMFQKLDGELAQVWHKGELRPLEGGWTLNVRSGELDTGAMANAAGAGGGDDTMRRTVLAGRQIAWAPPEDFRFEQSGGNTKLTYMGADWGVVKVGPHSTVFFLASGESITFDENGNVIQFNGITHIYHPLNDPIPAYEEPIENAADASVSNPTRR